MIVSADRKLDEAGPAAGLADFIRFVYVANSVPTCSKQLERYWLPAASWALRVEHTCFCAVGWPREAMCSDCAPNRKWWETEKHCTCPPQEV